MQNSLVSMQGSPYDVRARTLERERRLAALLSQQAQTPIDIQGGGGFGAQAPVSWLSVLAKGLQGVGSLNKEASADEREKSLSEADRAQAQALIRSITGEDNKTVGMRPIEAQTVPLPGIGGAPGSSLTMPGENNPGGVVNQPPDMQQRIAMLLGAQGGPQTQQIAQAMLPRVFADQDYQRGRGDRQADTAEQRQYQAQIAGQQRSQALEDDARNYQQQLGVMDYQNKLPLTATARAQIAAANQREGSWNQPVTEAGPDGKPILVQYNSNGSRRVVQGASPKPQARAPNAKLVNDVIKVGTNLETQDRLLANYKPEFSGNVVLGGMDNFIKRHQPGGDSTGQAQWWQDYQSYVNQVRNQLFGAALTPSEQAEFEKAIITPRMSPEESRKNLQRQNELSAKAAQRQTNSYLKMGYDREAIEGALGYTVDELNNRAKSAAAPTQQNMGGGWSARVIPPGSK